VLFLYHVPYMTLIESIDRDMKEAMKAKEEIRLSTLRMLRTALKNKQIDVQHELNDEEVQAVIKTMMKQYQDALRDFFAAGRTDLADRQQAELTILQTYLPPALSPEELEAIVQNAVQSSGVTDKGKAMGIAMKAVAGRADGTDVRAVVERLLS
jgi:uncharacterized protein YqeY